jgi:tRNA U34 5-carboxymethylaminomethyl modifying enzyme MnmG/GidA
VTSWLSRSRVIFAGIVDARRTGRDAGTISFEGQKRWTRMASTARLSSCLAYPEVGRTEVRAIRPKLPAIDPGIATRLEVDAKYDVYLKRQTADVDAFRREEALVLGELDYSLVSRLSNEARGKLSVARPWTVGQAGRLNGMTPAAIGILAAYLRGEARRRASWAMAGRRFT